MLPMPPGASSVSKLVIETDPWTVAQDAVPLAQVG